MLVTEFKKVPQELVNGVCRLQLQPICARGPWNSPWKLLGEKDWRAWPYVACCAAARGSSKRQNNLAVLDDKLENIPCVLLLRCKVMILQLGRCRLWAWSMGISQKEVQESQKGQKDRRDSVTTHSRVRTSRKAPALGTASHSCALTVWHPLRRVWKPACEVRLSLQT